MNNCDNQIIFSRRHPEYSAHESRWRRSQNAYSGGSNYVEQALIRHVSEIELEFLERQRRAYYFNYPRAIAQRITQYTLSVDPVRRNADPTLVEDWSRSGLRTNEVMRQLSTLLNVYGRAWLQIEMPYFSGTVTLERAKRERLRPFVRALSPFAVTDWAYAADGRLAWAIVAEEEFRNADPFTPPERIRRCRLYERDHWRLYQSTADGVHEVDCGINVTGQVPLIPVTEPDGFGIEANHWFEDVVKISEAILNNESEAQMNTVKQMFGMLVVSDSFVQSAQKLSWQGGKLNNLAAIVARSAAVIESVEEKGISRFINPSGVETRIIREENRALKAELYEVLGLAIQNRSTFKESAESKAWDFQNVSRFLSARADLLEQAELQAWQLMNRYDFAITVPELVYNRQFAVRDLSESISGLLQLSNLKGGENFHKAINRAAVGLIDAIGGISENEKNQIYQEINNKEEICPAKN